MGEEDTSDASPPPPWEHGVDAPVEDVHIFEDEESDTEMSTDSPVAPSEPSRPLRWRMAPLAPSDVPEQVVHAVDAVIMGSGVERLREMVSEDNGEVSHFIVDVLMLTMGGVDCIDDDAGDGTGWGTRSQPSIMSSSRAAVIASELVPYLPCGAEPSPRTRMARGLLAALSACTRNRTMCSASGLLAVLLDVAEKLFVGMGQGSNWDGIALVQCIQMLGGHSVSVRDLHSWLLLIKKALGTPWATPLILALEKAVGSEEAKGPAVTFEFDGECSGLLAPGDSRWPFSNGFGFATWIYVECFSGSLNTATAGVAVAAAASSTSGKSSPSAAAAAACTLAGEGTKHMPRIFSFLTSDNHGIEAYFHDHFLVVESAAGKNASLHFTYEFKPECWYFVGLEYTSKQSLLGKAESELRLYVDGDLHESCPFELPRIAKPLAFCCIGTNPSPTIAVLQRRRRQCPLFAEMGPIYIFMEPIGPERMSRLASRGGDALPSFGNGAGLPWKATSDHIREIAEDSYTLDIEIGGSLHLLYHPSLLNGRLCPDASPSGSTGTQRRPAEVLGRVPVSYRMRPAESLWALAYGGPMALLPLTVSNVEMDNLEPVLGDLSLSLATASLSVPIFRIISLAIRHPGNKEELCRAHGPELLSRVLHYLLEKLSKLESGKEEILSDEELVTAIVSLCQSQRNDHGKQVQLFSTLLLDLKMWSSCNYVLQKKLLSSLADMVFAESTCMRDANALQVLLDGCRRCYWVIHEADSLDTFTLTESERPLEKVNALVDELLVVIELLIGAATSTLASDDIRCLVGFVVDCPQPNQVARVLLLIYRLIVHPNISRAQLFAQSFISRGGVEALLVLLQREAKSGDNSIFQSSNEPDNSALWNESSNSTNRDSNIKTASSEANCKGYEVQSVEHHDPTSHESSTKLEYTSKWCLLKGQFLKNLGGFNVQHISDNVENSIYNIDNGDGVLVGIVHVLGALVASGHLTLVSPMSRPKLPSGFLTTSNGEGNTMFEDRVSLLLFALQKAFQAAPRRLMTRNVYRALISSVLNVSSSSDDVRNLDDSGCRFKQIQLLLVVLQSLPYASRAFQVRAIQDLLYLVGSHHMNRSMMTSISEWPEWILEVLVSNYEREDSKYSDGVTIHEVEDLIHNFLSTVLEYSMRENDGWKDVEATIHCAEWLSTVGGSSTGDQRIRREESLPIFKRRLLGSLLDFAAQELQVQTEGIAAAAAGVAAEGLMPKETKTQAEKAANLSVALAENAIVLLMFVEDHLRSRSQQFFMSCSDNAATPASMSSSAASRSNSLSRTGSEHLEAGGSRQSLSSDAGGLPVDVLASINGQISAEVMERVTAAAAAEPYGSVRHAFVSYGSCISDLSEGWKYRSRLWYGVCIPPKSNVFGGGGSGWVSWKSVLEKDSDGNWIELQLVKKSVAMLQTLLLDSGLGSCLATGVEPRPGVGVMGKLNQLIDSEQPFFCMLRLILVSLREDDNGEDDSFMRNVSMKKVISEELGGQTGSTMAFDSNSSASFRNRPAALLWRVLGPILNVPLSEAKRQRVLVVCSILYSELWHAVSSDRRPLRKNYVGLIMPPFVAVLKRYRSVLAGIHELAPSDMQNPLLVDDWASSADALPIEAGISMISPAWAAAFAAPPVAMALAMMAASASGTETITAPTNKLRRRDTSLLERRSAKLHTFASFQKPNDITSSLSTSAPKDKAAAKAAALAAARDLERSAKIGSRRGLSAVAMATSGHRRAAGDIERAQRWNTSEAMGAAWMECLQSADSKSVSGRDFSALSYKYVALLVSSFALARNLQRVEMERRTQVEILNRRCMSIGVRAWRHLLHCLIETNRLYGPFGGLLCSHDSIFWKLDSTESSLRMRRYMKRDYNWLNHLGGANNYEEENFLCDDAASNACRPEHGKFSHSNVFSNSLMTMAEAVSVHGGHEDTMQTETEIIWSGVDDQLSNSLPPDPSFTGSVDSRSSDFSGVRNLVRSMVVAPGYKLSEDDERIIVELPSSMVRPLKVVQGTFQVTSKRINFIVDEHMSDNYMDDVASTSGQYDQQDKDRSWFISSLHQIYIRRYLLRQSALELFMVDRSNFLFDFEDIGARTHAYRAIVHTKPPYLNDIFLDTQRPEQILKQTQLMERWAKWEISNFEYLMELNTLAGRSYNDITQYPVFPWVIADYQSKTLDLEHPSTYRDLSKPIGALNPSRLVKFQEHYSSFKDPIIPKFHYSSHYSSPDTVLYYLARIEPFTTLSAQLQAAKLDHDDRVFSDVTRTWNSVLEGINDVKELVPEMYYLPEVFTNVNSRLGPVALPPWAENPVDFIHKHRKALESDYVSTRLHEWIDLIFGYKQRGKEAVIANNVFPNVTYEGMVDVDKITDPVQRRATQNQVSYFGQTPTQLLTVPHMKRRPLVDIIQLQTIFRIPSEVRSYALPSPDHCNIPASALLVSDDCIVVIDANVPAVHVALHHWQPNTPDGLGAPFLFHHGRNAINSSDGAIFRIFKGSASSVEDYHFPRAIAFAASAIQNSSAVVVTCDKEVITGRHADNSVKLISPDGARTIETAYGHLAPVTCLALSADSNYLVTGSRDTTVILWRIRQVGSSLQKSAPEPPPSTPTTPKSPLAGFSPSKVLETSRRRRIEGPMHVLRGHLREVTCCSVSSDLGLVASSSSVSGVLLHSLRTGRLIRKLDVQEAHSIRLSSQGIVLIWSESEKRLSTFTVNGIPVATSTLSPFSGRVSCIEISTDGHFALLGTCSVSSNHDGFTATGENDEIDKPDDDEDVQESKEAKLSVHVPSICFLDLYKLEVIHTLRLEEGQDVTALALNKDNTSLLVSTADKQLTVFTGPPASAPTLL